MIFTSKIDTLAKLDRTEKNYVFCFLSIVRKN